MAKIADTPTRVEYSDEPQPTSSGGGSFGAYASASALETAHPAASNPGATATVAGVPYASNGMAWVPLLSPLATADLSVGYADTIANLGTVSSGTVTPVLANGQVQMYINGGAHTLAPPTVPTGRAVKMQIIVTNGASAGAIAVSGFSKSSAALLSTTNGQSFNVWISVDNLSGTTYSELTVTARQ